MRSRTGSVQLGMFSKHVIHNSNTVSQTIIKKMHFRSGNSGDDLNPDIVRELKQMLDECNVLAQTYRAARERYSLDGLRGVRLKLIKSRATDGRTYNLPSACEIAGLIVGDFDNLEGARDIIVETQSKKLQRISELHPLYLPLQYPLLFPYGEDGYREDIFLRDSSASTSKKRTTLSMREFFAYRIQIRVSESSVLLCSRKLLQQFLVDAYTMVESSRLSYIRHNQDQLRADMYKGIQERILQGDTDARSTGARIILPGSFTGSPRYMFNNFVDALQICNWIGFPCYFVTVTCNPKWPEVQRALDSFNLRPEDRPDILCRIFKMKLDTMIKGYKSGNVFGKVRACKYQNPYHSIAQYNTPLHSCHMQISKILS